MGPEWMLEPDNSDLLLFPDLAEFNKKSVSRSMSTISSESESLVKVVDDELLDYFSSRGDTEDQTSSPQQLTDLTPVEVELTTDAPDEVGYKTVILAPTTESGATVGRRSQKGNFTVATLCESANGGPVLVVNKADNNRLIVPKGPVDLQPTVKLVKMPAGRISCQPDKSKVPAMNYQPPSPSSSVEDDYARSPGLCMSKNAVAARENRLKKKSHVQNLEKSVEELKEENSSLKTEVTDMHDTIESLQNEVTYLRSVLANQGTLAKLLENIPLIPDVSVSKTNALANTSELRATQSKKRQLAVDERHETVDSDDDCDCHPDKNVCMCSKENHCHPKSSKYAKRSLGRQPSESTKGQQPDHSYASDNSASMGEKSTSNKSSHGRRPSTRGRPTSSDQETTGGVCLHVSGSSVSLEFCSTCSHKAVGSRKKSKK